jgi:N-acetylmuramic acid 6-phosphate etherase
MQWSTTNVTEQRNPATTNIDQLSADAIVRLILDEDQQVLPAVAAVGDRIAALAEIVAARIRQGGRLIYVGAGTSGRLGALDAAECPPTYGTTPHQVVALIAGGSAALTGALEDVEDDAEGGAQEIAALDVGPDDVVLGIAASGRTPYVIGAIKEARARGAYVAGLACNDPSRLAEHVDLMIAPVVGPEVITGSTRMKAGTAQKLVLNTLSTTVMIRLGRTYGNLLSNMHTTNHKLRARAAHIVAMAADLEIDQARDLLHDAGGDLKTALMMALAGLSAADARTRLDAAGGMLRQALADEDHD